MNTTRPGSAQGGLAEAPFHLGYRPGLDGLRGVAILMVLLLHLQVLGEGFGFVGVDVFFVLSGFLITCLLVEESQRTQRIKLGSFYCRRALRLLPALLAMLVAFVVYAFLEHPHGRAVRELQEALRALFYFTNWSLVFHWGHREFLNHTWSLSIEEQFYLLWPLSLLLLLRRTAGASLMRWLILAALLSWLVRAALFLGGTENIGGNVYELSQTRLSAGLDTRADSLLLGCLAAVAFAYNLLPRTTRFATGLRRLSFVAVLGLAAFCFVPVCNAWNCCIGWFFISLLAAVVIARLVAGPGGPLVRVVESAPLVFLGKISYGLYVWHYPIFIACQRHHWDHWQLFAIPLTAIVVLMSYYLLELPCLKLKRKLQPLSGAPVQK